MKVSPAAPPVASPSLAAWARRSRGAFAWAAALTAVAAYAGHAALALGPRDCAGWAFLAGYAVAHAEDVLRGLRRSLA